MAERALQQNMDLFFRHSLALASFHMSEQDSSPRNLINFRLCVETNPFALDIALSLCLFFFPGVSVVAASA